jgi:hypothetical protein
MTITEQIKAAQAQLKALQSQVKSNSFKMKDGKTLTVKIGEKGTLNIYGLGKFPVCLYLSQALKLQELLSSPELELFVNENADKIAVRKAE